MSGRFRASVRLTARPRRPASMRGGIEERPRQRSCAEKEVDPVGSEVVNQLRMHRRAIRAKLQHVADDGDPPPVRPRPCRAEQRQRSAHRGWIGVVTLVDDRGRTVGASGSRSVRPCPSAPKNAPARSAHGERLRQARGPPTARRVHSEPCAGPARQDRNAYRDRKVARGHAILVLCRSPRSVCRRSPR